jgi:DNA-binding LacI/PurR family transcriptional regulator
MPDSGGKPSRPGQKDIARAADVSQSAVSLVLNGRAAENSIPQTTQQRILQAARELGYVPNVAARSLRGGRNGLIGVHTFERVFPVKPGDYYHEFLVGIEEKAVELGQDLVLFASTQGPDSTRSIYGSGRNRLRIADGAVMVGMEQNDEELVRLAGEGYPFVFIGHRHVEGAEFPFVSVDYRAALRDVLDMLTERGHRQICYLGSRRRTGPWEERLAGFRRHTRHLGLPADRVRLIDPAEVSVDLLTAESTTGTTALLAETYELAEAVHRQAGAAGVFIPAQMSFVCLDVAPHDVPWSQLVVPRRQLGSRAIEMLIEILDDPVNPVRSDFLSCPPPDLRSIAPTTGRATPGRAPRSG